MKKLTVLFVHLLGVFFGLLGPVAPSALAQEGIFADFATSMGSFTCVLDYTNAPMAVANFIGLATGQRAWIEEPTGRVRTDGFYNHLTFHRVIAGFMIQGGSPNGQGTDGPGFVFPDQFSPALRHDSPGVLSMANSGKNSNGAQYFITVTNTPWLDDVHVAFGRVISNMSAVYNISQVATDASSKPLTSVVVQSVTIRRVGATAQAFDINAQHLPVISGSSLHISAVSTNFTLNFTNGLYARNFLAASTNLVNWNGSSLGIDVTGPVLTNVMYPNNTKAQYYFLSRAQYPSNTFAPRAVTNRTLTMVFGNNLGTITNIFDASGRGIYTYTSSQSTTNGTIDAYSWSQEPYRGMIWPIYYSKLNTMTLQLNFTNENAGSFAGTVYSSNPFNVTGAFRLTP